MNSRNLGAFAGPGPWMLVAIADRDEKATATVMDRPCSSEQGNVLIPRGAVLSELYSRDSSKDYHIIGRREGSDCRLLPGCCSTAPLRLIWKVRSVVCGRRYALGQRTCDICQPSYSCCFQRCYG